MEEMFLCQKKSENKISRSLSNGKFLLHMIFIHFLSWVKHTCSKERNLSHVFLRNVAFQFLFIFINCADLSCGNYEPFWLRSAVLISRLKNTVG
jgi:hypothetical protein